MALVYRSLRSLGVLIPCVGAVAAAVACSAEPPLDLGWEEPATGGSGVAGNHAGTTGNTGGSAGRAGTTGGTGGATGATGGTTGATGGTTGATGGTTGATGGTTGATGGTAGSPGGRGNATGGAGGRMGGAGMGGRVGGGGMFGAGGTAGTPGRGGTGAGGRMGSAGTGGSGGSGTAGSPPVSDACAVTTMPSGGTPHNSSNASGMAGGLAWTIWTNSSPGTITTFDTTAFSASWNNSGDYLARIGLQWNASKTYDQYGTITAQYSSKKTGSGGGYSYIGMYGWSVSPCVEWYIVDDSFNKMPVNPGSTQNKGTAMIDGGSYTLYTRNTSGTGGSKCSGVSSWVQFYSVRQSARTCGTISVTAHFDAWKAAGMALGKMDQAQILVEVGGGSGSVEFPLATVSSTM